MLPVFRQLLNGFPMIDVLGLRPLDTRTISGVVTDVAPFEVAHLVVLWVLVPMINDWQIVGVRNESYCHKPMSRELCRVCSITKRISYIAFAVVLPQYLHRYWVPSALAIGQHTGK